MLRNKTARLYDFVSLTLGKIPLKPLKFAIELMSIGLSVYVIAQFIPESWLNELPATGGDTGSHFWPVKVLHDYGLPHFTVRPWNPGNNGGEGLLVHYFPLPFVFMALLGYVIPLGLAFNIGTLLPVISLPVAIWGSVRMMSGRMSAAILAGMFSAAVVLNEGYSMWGGNTLSTLAGQFAHMYALNFLVLGLGVLWREIERKKVPWKSSLLFSCVAISHGYIYFGVPPLMLLVILLHPKSTYQFRTVICGVSASLSLMLSIWFVGPMVMNGPWVTAHSFSWAFQNWVDEVMPRILEPIVISGILSILALTYRGLQSRDFKLLRVSLLWFGAALIYLLFFFVFRWLKLVDVRAIPQTQLFIATGVGCLLSTAIRPLPKRMHWILSALVIGFLCFWETIHVFKFPIWLDWNYSGWQSKPKYKELLLLSEQLKGDLSQPRVAYEHHVKNNSVGTERVFEMLPYFANRATTESLYLQSTVLAPMLFSLTSEISERSSCPFHEWPCMPLDVVNSEGRQELLGVEQLILSTPVALRGAEGANFLKREFSFGPWTVFSHRTPVRMAEVFTQKPETVEFKYWRNRFWNWFRVYQKGKPFLVTAKSEKDLPKDGTWTANQDCHPTTTVDFSGIHLKTDCPGVAHLLKYAYHPSFTSSGGEPLFLVSPGFLGVVPASSEVEILFGAHWTWALFRWLSLIFLALTFGLVWKQKKSLAWVEAHVRSKKEIKAQPKQKIKSRKARSKSTPVHSKMPFYCLLALAIGSYLQTAIQTESLFFWNWRKLNFREFEIVSNHQGYGILHKNENLKGEPIILKGSVRYSGLATHANSETRIRINSGKRYLTGSCGYPDYANGAQIRCEIQANGRTLFSSPPINSYNREVSFRVPIFRDQEVLLITKSLKNDINVAHVVWVDLKIE